MGATENTLTHPVPPRQRASSAATPIFTSIPASTTTTPTTPVTPITTTATATTTNSVDAIDALYFLVVSVTTTGYGEIVPRHWVARIFTSVYVLVGMGLLGVAAGALSNHLLDSRPKVIAHPNSTASLDNISDN